MPLARSPIAWTFYAWYSAQRYKIRAQWRLTTCHPSRKKRGITDFKTSAEMRIAPFVEGLSLYGSYNYSPQKCQQQRKISRVKSLTAAPPVLRAPASNQNENLHVIEASVSIQDPLRVPSANILTLLALSRSSAAPAKGVIWSPQ